MAKNNSGGAFVPFTRVIAILMSAVLCFGILVPLALQRHNAGLAIAVGAVYAAYVVANVMLWRRLKLR